MRGAETEFRKIAYSDNTLQELNTEQTNNQYGVGTFKKKIT